jgi:hypothetical protein
MDPSGKLMIVAEVRKTGQIRTADTRERFEWKKSLQQCGAVSAPNETQTKATLRSIKSMLMNSTQVFRFGITLSLAMFGASLFGMTLLDDRGGQFLIGFACFLFGWGSHLAWYANPLMFISLLLMLRGRYLGAGAMALAALALASTTFSIQETWLNEAGTKAPVVGYGWGFYLWFGSIIVLLGTAVGCWLVGPPDRKVALASDPTNQNH